MSDTDKAIKQLGDNIKEVLESAAAVKGEDFAELVAGELECLQIIDLIRGLNEMVLPDQRGLAEAMTGAAIDLLASVASKMCGELDEADVKEAIALGDTLFERRMETAKLVQEQIRRQGRDL